MRFTCLPAASAQSVRFWNVPDRVGPNNKCDENEALGVGYLVPEVTQLSNRMQSRVSWFHSAAKSGRLLGRTEPATRSCGRGRPGTQAWSGLSGGCVSQGALGQTRQLGQARRSCSPSAHAHAARARSLFAPATGPDPPARAGRAPQGPRRTAELRTGSPSAGGAAG